MKSSPANDISPLCPNVSSTTNDTKSEFTSSNVSHITNDTESTEFTSCLICLGHVWAVESTGDRLDLPAVAVVCTGWTECVPRLSSGWRISRADPSSIWPCSSLAELRWCLSGQYWSFHCEGNRRAGNNISSSGEKRLQNDTCKFWMNETFRSSAFLFFYYIPKLNNL